jgi:hypothetical protein
MPKGGLRRSVVQNHNNQNLQRSSCATAFSEHRRGRQTGPSPISLTTLAGYFARC